MKMTDKMAKVITMSIKLNRKHVMKIVTTVDPVVTPEMACSMYGIRGHLVNSEVSSIMPLPMALDYSYRLQKKLGIAH